ncbi:PREDICTED: serine/threonine-protein phosphatase 6 regulatory ankyrin repeat subunit A isoform X2 [Nicrophorus vespilloides]|uniref:Serine/threonine-protein phosphatase 6 regulatory ankyrin repeat subunit A isoform X2 n=1 Tax=Nicrophorus vespilloides TaxID=110193 RepID=A0ABM1N4R0_NICVS|nr:PREDICTED: serine/threonine-protein phosphatase 6 regulatory ankyrin repeat subunit A isoform X2 [Nicrophorus vespilloides]
MSQPQKKGASGAGKGPPKGGGAGDANGNKEDGKEKKTKDKEVKEAKDKDEVGSVVDEEAAAAAAVVPKPQSAGATVRDAAQKVLALCQKGEWGPVDQVIKSMEKAMANAGEDANTMPLLGIADPATGMTPLMYAVKDNRTSILDRLIELGSDVGARNNDNYNALHISAMHSREDVVKLLLTKRGVDPYSTGGSRQQTAVHLVASRQTGTATAILRALLASAGKDIRLKPDGRGKIPLLLAVEAGNQSMCRELLGAQTADQLKASSANGDTALHLAARRKDIDMVRILVDYGTSVDIQNGEGQTPLHIAAAEGDEILVKYFYGVRASASITDNQDRTPMHLAAENGHASIIELLADKFKASILERTKDGSTLMHIASLNGHADCAMMLFKKGVYLHMPNKDGARSIHTAARYGHVGIINTLIQKGEKVDVTTNENYTALHIAVESCKPIVVETLLGYGADVHIRGGKLKETALHIAARVKDGERCALMLLKSGAGPNLTTEDGQTPVHVAAQYGNLQTLEFLLEDGGDPQYKNKKGETPLHLACKGCRPDVVQHLIDYVKLNKGEDKVAIYVNELNEFDETALHYICNVSKADVELPGADRGCVKVLLQNGADVSLVSKLAHETAFHYVAEVGNNEVFTEMISHMPVTDVQKALNRQSAIGWTPLSIASHKGHVELVHNLLANHARVDVFDHEGRSALHLAAEKGYIQVCDYLLTNKAFINSKSRNGRTALHLASLNGYIHLVKFLIKDHNAVIDILTLKKQTPLHLAAGAGQIEVCKLLLELGANIDATDDQGQKPIHAAAQNNYSEVAKLFLQQHPSLVMATTKDGNTCAHIAAAQGSVTVIEELMKFDRSGVISARNKLTDATPLQIAAEGGHADVVKALVRAGASVTDENKNGFTAVHLAAKNGHGHVLEVLRSSNTLRVTSKKLGVTPLHVAAYFGQADTVRELLIYVPGTVKSEVPNGASLVPTLGNESGMTPLHLAAYSGNENVVRLLLNSAGVQVDAATHENGYNPMHLACFGGHTTVVGLLLSRSAELLQSTEKHGKTGLHIAATNGHYQMVEVLLGQGAEINATDKNGWTPLHYASRAGCFDVVKLLTESGASPKSETNLGAAPIWFAASEGHHDVLEYLMTKEHETYSLMEDRRFVYNLMVCSKNHNNRPIEEFILVSPAPVDTAAKLSNILITLSTKEKERAKDLIAAGKHCEYMATELLALAAGADSAGRILTATDNRNVEFLDVLIENEQKEVIAHTVVQRYLQELWRGQLNWTTWRTLLLFIGFILCPPIWVAFTLPLGHKYHKVPIIKFMSYLTSHVYLMFFLLLTAIFPFYPVVRPGLIPYWYELVLLIWLSGLLLFELTNPSDKSGLGWIKLSVLLFGIFGVAAHLFGMVAIEKMYWPTLMYCRNQLFAISFLLACVQILDFLSFHHLFGPWAIIIGNLMKDLGRFLAVLAIFVFGFSMHFVALNQPFKNFSYEEARRFGPNSTPKTYFAEVQKNPIKAFELLFFAIFGQTTTNHLKTDGWERNHNNQPFWTANLFKMVFGVYMLVSVVVLINLLIAMMTDTYQRIQAQSDIEWKFGLSKLIRSMHRTTSAPSPINLITTWLFYLVKLCKQRMKAKKRTSLVNLMGGFQRTQQLSPRSKAGQKWLSKVKKGRQIAPKESVALSVAHLSPLGSQLSFSIQTNRIEHVTDWEAIAKKYRALTGSVDEVKESGTEEDEDDDNQPTQMGNNVGGG